MILVAGPDVSIAVALPEPHLSVEVTTDLPATVPAESVLLVAPDDVPDVADLLATARERTDGALVVVAVATDSSSVDRRQFDGVVAPDASAEAVRSTAERARRLVAYREAVSDFYDACRRGDAEVSRDAADERYGTLDGLDAGDLTSLLFGDREG